MNGTWKKIAAILAAIIGAMAVFAGGKVLLGNDPGYYVIDWLPVYNFTVGALSLFVTSVILWIGSRYALPAALATFSVHGIVMLILQGAYRDVVASDSIRAMTIRLIAWAIILALAYVGSRQGKASRQAETA